jgi:hypothetical protein
LCADRPVPALPSSVWSVAASCGATHVQDEPAEAKRCGLKIFF